MKILGCYFSFLDAYSYFHNQSLLCFGLSYSSIFVSITNTYQFRGRRKLSYYKWINIRVKKGDEIKVTTKERILTIRLSEKIYRYQDLFKENGNTTDTPKMRNKKKKKGGK